MNIFQLSLFWVLCFANNLSVLLGKDPCKLDDYKDLNQGDRSETYKDATDKCDGNDLQDEWHYWYLVSGNAGNALATIKAPAKGRCGTTDRLYLKDHHPFLGEGEVTLRLCIAEGNEKCQQERSIQVINCGAFYLYKLYNHGGCSTPWRYCTNGEKTAVSCENVKCPSGQTCALQKNGEERHCQDPNQVPETTTVPPVTETSTSTPKPATNATTASPTSETTTGQPTMDTTTVKPTSDKTTAQSAANVTTASSTAETTAQPTTDTITAKPTSDTITAQPATNATTASPTSETTAQPPTDTTTAKPTSHTTKAQPATNATTASPTLVITAQPRTDTTTAKPTSDTTKAQPATNATTASPTSVTTAQPTTDTITAKPTSDTITAQPATNATTASPTSETTAQPPTDTTTAKPTSDTTKAQPATNATTASPTLVITAQPRTDTTTAKPTSDTTKAQPATNATTASPTSVTTAQPTTDTITAKPTSDTITAQPATNATTASPTSETTAQPPTDTTTAKPTSDTTKAQPATNATTASPTLVITAQPTTDTTTAKPTSDTTKAQPATNATTASPTSVITAQPTTDTTTAKPTLDTNTANTTTTTTNTITKKPATTSTTEKPTSDTTTITLKSAESIPTPSSKYSVLTTTAKEPDTTTKTLPTATVKPKSSEAIWLKSSAEREITELASATLQATATTSKIEEIITSTAVEVVAEPVATEILAPTASFQTANLNSKLSTTEPIAHLGPGTSSLATTEEGRATELAVTAAMSTITLEGPAGVTSAPLPSQTAGLQARKSVEAASSESSSATETTEQAVVVALSTKSNLKLPLIATSTALPSVSTLETGKSITSTATLPKSTLKPPAILAAASSSLIKITLDTVESTLASSSEILSTLKQTGIRATFTLSILEPSSFSTSTSFPSLVKLKTRGTKQASSKYLATLKQAAISVASTKSTLESPIIETSLLFPSITTLQTRESTESTSSGTTKEQEAVLMISTNTESKLTPPTRTATSREATEEMNTALETLFKSEIIKTTKMLTLPHETEGKTVTPPLHAHGSTSLGVATTITTPTATTIAATTAEGMATVTSVAGQPDDPCVPNPCENYGECLRTVEPQGFYCSCTSEYTGAACENKIVHGNWGIWTQWPNCNKPCNGGNKTRKRQCDTPKPAFGGRYCIGSATETQFCNMDSCPADELNYEVRFKAETWSDELENPDSELYKNYKDEIQDTVMAFYLENGETVTFKLLSLRQGSIIASFNVTYPAIDSLQVVVLQEQIAGGTLGNFSAELLNITSSYVPNEAPVILESKSSTSTTIELKWSEVTQLNSVPLLGYVIIYKERNTKFQHDIHKSVLPLPREKVLKDLKKFTNYTIRVYAFTRNGNGIPSEAVTLQTQEDVPSESPPNIVMIVTSSRTIRVSWQPMNKAYVHGILLGYEVRYANDDGSTLTWIRKRRRAEIQQVLLDELAPYTWYWVVICARTSKGCGKEYFDYVQTWEDVPSMPPVQLTAYNFTSEASIAVSWSPVPSNHINGILLGYSLKYERLQTSERQVIDVDEHMLTLRATDLSVSLQVQAYSIYRIGVAAFTRKGIGPYTEYAYAESCRCPKVLYTNFWSTSPYLKLNVDDSKMEGIFSRIVTDMIFAACGLCPGHGSSTIIKITTNGKGEYSAKKSISEVLGDIDDVPQISFPIYGNKDITRYLGAYAYINLVESPGVAFIAAKRLPGSMAKNMINAVLECTPMIMLSACMAYVSGFILWVLDSRFNPDEFPPAFIKGVGEGFWWSFISMTTVGYGDRSPRSILARIFGIIWILTGLVVISILIGAIASSLTFITVDKPVTLYGAKIGAIQNSVEYHLGILKNAKVNEEREYNSVDEIRTAIEEGEIDGALLDTYVAAEHKETLFNDRVYVKEILDRPIGYGVVLSGAAVSVEQRCRDYINMHITEIFHIIQNMTKTLDAPAENFAMEQSTRLFDSTSEMFRIAMASLLAVLGVALLGGLSYHFLIYLPRRKRINEERTTELQCSYRKALKREMMAFVDSFYEDMSKKISSIKKELQQEILNKKARPKCTVQVDRSAESSKRDTESSLLGSCSTLSSWTSETQYEKCKQIFELVSNSGNIQLERGSQQDLQKPFPSSSGENCFSQTLPNVVISDDDVKNGDSSC